MRVEREESSTESAVLVVGDLPFRIQHRLAIGDTCNLYHCTADKGRAMRASVFKIARDVSDNARLITATNRLRRLYETDERLLPFLPRVSASLQYRGPAEAEARAAAVLTYHNGIRSPNDLYSLEEVRQSYPRGLEARDMAWMWRRLLTVLAYVHDQQIVHAAITPAHVMIEPKEHKLVLVGWGAAAFTAAPALGRPASYRAWFDDADTILPALDIKTAAQTMLLLLGQRLHRPPSIDAALLRYFDRCLKPAGPANAWQLLSDFDRLIEVLWGPRQFRPFAMPPRPPRP
ncbi:MAG: hypothetical protein JWM57_3956 [Phycisphaerales bacterium]|nr:hypothetical protein [Phycisphaerales bacterium]